jgi:hypothetical protein
MLELVGGGGVDADAKANGMRRVLEMAVELRSELIHEVVALLCPAQVVHFLLIVAELLLVMHDFGAARMGTPLRSPDHDDELEDPVTGRRWRSWWRPPGGSSPACESRGGVRREADVGRREKGEEEEEDLWGPRG